MLRKKTVYPILALLALISLLSVSAIVIKTPHPSEEKEEIHSTIEIKYSMHNEYERVVFFGPHELINSGKVRHNDNEVSVTFPDSAFSLKEEKIHLPFRREKNRIIFHQDSLEKIKVLNLSNPSRLVIDFYTAKADSDQHESSHIEKNEEAVNARIAAVVEQVLQVLDKKEQKPEISEKASHMEKNEEGLNTRIAAVVEQVLQVLDNKEHKVEGQKMEISEKTSNIEKNEALVSKVLDTGISDMVERVLQVLDNREQKVASLMPEKPENKDTIAEVAATAPAVLMIPTTSEVQTQSSKYLDKDNTNPAETLKISKVSAITVENQRSIIHTDTAKDLEGKTGADNINKITSDLSKPVKPDIQVDALNNRIAILPFDNFSGNNEALGKIMPLILSQLKDRGYDVIDYKEIEAFLCERRVRNSSFISREIAMELAKLKKVSTVVAGSVFTYSADVNPMIGLMARRVDLKTGQIIWSDFISLTGEDYTRVLGLGTIKSVDMLIPNALNNLFATFENRSPEKDSNAKYRIAVLPFKNESKHRHAGMIITHLFQNELANNPMFDPVDYGDVKKTIVNLRVGRKGEVDYNNLKALSQSLGVDVVLTGTVEEYQSGREYYSPPIVTISARLLDSKRNRILWYENLQLDGEENIIALDWGRLRSADKVAYGAVSGLVENMNTKGLFR